MLRQSRRGCQNNNNAGSGVAPPGIARNVREIRHQTFQLIEANDRRCKTR
jgi:hypothetical protein